MKKSVFIILLLAASSAFAQNYLRGEQKITITPPVMGIKNDVARDEIGDTKHAWNMLNTWLTEQGEVSKRLGTGPYGSQSTSEPVRGQYTFIKDDGSKYFLRLSSATLEYTTGDGSWTTLIATMSKTANPCFVTFLNRCVISNGTGDVYVWDGDVLISSATFLKFKTMAVWQERIWGSTGNSIFYHGTLNELAGDCFFAGSYLITDRNAIITAMHVFNGVLYIFTEDSIYAAVWQAVYGVNEESIVTNFVVRQVTKEYGCAYHQAIDEFNGSLVFWDRKGVVEMKADTNGNAQFALRSSNLDGELWNMPQSQSSHGIEWLENESVDFGDGKGVSIDTTTVANSIRTAKNSVTNGGKNQSAELNVPDDSTNYYEATESLYQSFRTTGTFRLGMVKLAISYYWDLMTGDPPDNPIYVRIKDKDNIMLSSVCLQPSQLRPYYDFTNVDFSTYNVLLQNEATYYLDVYSASYLIRNGVYEEKKYFWSPAYNYYTRGQSSFSSSYDLGFYIYQSTYAVYSQYQSDIHNMSGATSWGKLIATQNVPNGSNISWYVSAATDTALVSSNTLTAVNNGSQINLSATPYIMYFASITTYGNTPPSITSVKINAYETNIGNPVAIHSWDDYLYVSVTTPTMTRNGRIYVANSNWAWTKWEGINAYSFEVFREILYSGSSLNDGWTIEINKTDTYNDSGFAYDCFIEYPDLDFGAPFNEKILTRMYTKAENSGDWNLKFGYTFNGAASITCDKNIYLGLSDRFIGCRTNFPVGSRCYMFRPRFENNNLDEYFTLKGAQVYFTIPVEPLK